VRPQAESSGVNDKLTPASSRYRRGRRSPAISAWQNAGAAAPSYRATLSLRTAISLSHDEPVPRYLPHDDTIVDESACCIDGSAYGIRLHGHRPMRLGHFLCWSRCVGAKKNETHDSFILELSHEQIIRKPAAPTYGAWDWSISFICAATLGKVYGLGI
jgi:hypothetical protein